MDRGPDSPLFVLRVVYAVVIAVVGNAITGTDNGSSSTRITIVNQDDADRTVLVEIEDDPNAKIPDGPKVFYSAGRTMENGTEAELKAFNKTGDYDVTMTVSNTSITKRYSFGLNDTMTISVQNGVPYIATNCSSSSTGYE